LVSGRRSALTSGFVPLSASSVERDTDEGSRRVLDWQLRRHTQRAQARAGASDFDVLQFVNGIPDCWNFGRARSAHVLLKCVKI
jgi:hypothetical protein